MENIKACFFLPNAGISQIDYNVLEDGNPGIGGSQYSILLIAKSLSNKCPEMDISLVITHKNKYDMGIPSIQANDVMDAIKTCEHHKINILIIPYSYYSKYAREIKCLNTDLKIIVWCHNFASIKDLGIMTKSKCIARIITVGQEQMDIYRDHQAFKKTDYIYNAVHDKAIYAAKSSVVKQNWQRQNIVTYIGNIIESKGFHLLANAWPQVIQKVPDATLNIIGSGELYDRNIKLGPLGIAEEHYESTFAESISKNGKLLPSVKFWGILGPEKNKILLRTKVGVPNPSGLTETFGYTAVEMQLYGTGIVTKKCAGYLDTVVTKNSILYDNPDDLAKSIIELLLSDRNYDYMDTVDFILQKFALSKIEVQWKELIASVGNSNAHLRDYTQYCNPNYDLKNIKERLRVIKNILPFGYDLIPTIGSMQRLFRFIKKSLKRGF